MYSRPLGILTRFNYFESKNARPPPLAEGRRSLVPKILHSDPKHEFFLIYQSRVCEMLRNTSKHHFVSNGLEYASQHWYPEIVHSGPKYEFCTFYVLRLGKCSETLANIILVPID
jgi:hypothetical protein